MSSEAPKVSFWDYFNNNKPTSNQNKPDIIDLNSPIANVSDINTTENTTALNTTYNPHEGENFTKVTQIMEAEKVSVIFKNLTETRYVSTVPETQIKDKYTNEGASADDNNKTDYKPLAEDLLWQLTAVLASSLHRM